MGFMDYGFLWSPRIVESPNSRGNELDESEGCLNLIVWRGAFIDSDEI